MQKASLKFTLKKKKSDFKPILVNKKKKTILEKVKLMSKKKKEEF